MADLTASGVTIDASWIEKGLGGKHLKVRQATVVLSSAGSATAGEQIAASLFDLTNIIDCSPLVKSDNSVITLTSPSYDKTLLLLKSETAATSLAISGTFKLTIKGE